MTSIILIAVSGGSASGKTTVAKKLAALMGNEAVVLEMDSYYKDLSHLTTKEREKVNFDHPDAMDLKLFKKHLKELKSGRPIDKPLYNFHTHALEAKTVKFEPKRVVVIDGLFVLLDQLREEFDLKVYIDTPEKIRLDRRIKRDVKERGRDRESVLKQYHLTVKPMHEEHIEPTKRHADVVMSWEKDDSEKLKEIVKKIKVMLFRD